MEKATNKSFKSRETFENLTNEIFYTRPDELIYGVSIGKSYLAAVER